MITYVNTVLVSTNAATLATKEDVLKKFDSKSEVLASDANGKFVIMKMDGDISNEDLAKVYNGVFDADENVKKFRLGFVTGKATAVRTKTDGVKYMHIIKWSNPIKIDDITSFVATTYPAGGETQDTVTLDFTKVNPAVMTEFEKGERRIIVRLTFKDMPTRYRKWTESYEYVTAPEDNATKIAENIAKQINNQYKRARVVASAAAGVLTLEAMPYDDDDMNDSLNWANKVRFSVNAYYTDPTAPAFASKNKYSITGLEIAKTPGVYPTTAGKLVRDRESQAMGYQGILNRGECTWPIIKPDMVTDITKNYDGLTLMFENHYHAADDQIRQTKECVEIYDVTGNHAGFDAIKTFVEAAIEG